MAEFADQAELRVRAGDGGHGCASVHREKFKPLGGPDGGNGGRGGDVIIEVDPGVVTLLDFHRRPHRRAGNGKPGAGSHRSGGNGPDVVLTVPDGTVVRNAADGTVLADLHLSTLLEIDDGRARRPRERRPGLDKAQGTRLRAAGRARRRAAAPARAEDGGRRGPGGLPERGQVIADRRDVSRPA